MTYLFFPTWPLVGRPLMASQGQYFFGTRRPWSGVACFSAYRRHL